MNLILKERLERKTLIFDGATGTELYKKNFFVNSSYENLCLASPKAVMEIHQAYKDAGAEVVTTNSYGANFNKLNKFGLGDKVDAINSEAVRLARKTVGSDILVAASVGPLGEIPDGTAYSDDEAATLIANQIKALAIEVPDFLIFETLSTRYDVTTALRALEIAKPDLEYVLSFTFAPEGVMADGTTIAEIFNLVNSTNAAAFGLNCGTGPDKMLEILEKALPLAKKPLIVQPNAGVPKNVDGRMICMCTPEYFTTYALRYAALGARGLGGCCGTTPDDIRDMARAVNPLAKIQAHASIFTDDNTPKGKEPVPAFERSNFAAKLMRGEWVCNIEIVPPQGYQLENTIEKAIICREAGFDAINIPDGPRASSRVSTIVTAYRIQELAKIEVILHQCCRDKNLIGMQSDLLGCAALGINNILFITGDPPKLGDYPFASGVFDIDSIGMLKLQTRLNRGIDLGGKEFDPATKSFMGSGADPNAIDMEREIRRTREKIEAGAEYIITQPVFDVDSLLRFADAVPELESIPIIAGIWPLASFRNAEFMKNEVPGVVVPDEVMKRMGAAPTKEEQRATGIAIAREAIAKVRNRVAGVQVSAPFGNVNTAIAVIK